MRARKVAKALRPSKSLETVKVKAQLQTWEAMLTFKPTDSDSVERSNKHQTYLIGLLRRELRGSVGFLVVREFGTGRSDTDRADRSHFHAVLTKPIPEGTVDRLQRGFLRRCGLRNNQSRAFEYKVHHGLSPCTFGDYVSKVKKGKIDVISAPYGWDYKKLRRPYHFSSI